MRGFKPLKSCANGCDAPVCPPSKVICRACMDKITANLEEMVRKGEEMIRVEATTGGKRT